MGVAGVTFDVIDCVVGTVVITCGGCESRDDVFFGSKLPRTTAASIGKHNIFIFVAMHNCCVPLCVVNTDFFSK